ncbi:hypothetical protein CYMTET_37138 [Cymbomonas tetramitiformis]|uniref:Uncharacterized protein n=1 Tax=Cymbomonas tetramitiformis TaxID=36881 RepID=A0AAE0CEM3_9CHLO|nr:hypothetical protein CYMTET_37138 [Cymbomonas tetramitiformis]
MTKIRKLALHAVMRLHLACFLCLRILIRSAQLSSISTQNVWTTTATTSRIAGQSRKLSRRPSALKSYQSGASVRRHGVFIFSCSLHVYLTR